MVAKTVLWWPETKRLYIRYLVAILCFIPGGIVYAFLVQAGLDFVWTVSILLVVSLLLAKSILFAIDQSRRTQIARPKVDYILLAVRLGKIAEQRCSSVSAVVTPSNNIYIRSQEAPGPVALYLPEGENGGAAGTDQILVLQH